MKKHVSGFKSFVYTLWTLTLFVSCSTADSGQQQSNVSIQPLKGPVIIGKSVNFNTSSANNNLSLSWDFGDGQKAEGRETKHVYSKPGVYTVRLYENNKGVLTKESEAIIRVHTAETIHLPQVFLDTDARNEADDQHYVAYAIYSELDILGINSIHNNSPGSEAINYGEIFYVLKLMNWSGMPWDSLPLNKIYHGAETMLTVPESGKWYDTKPVISAGSNAILAAARGASPDNPVWVLPVGPCTNIASAVLQARKEGFNLQDRIRVFWLGGLEKGFSNEYNGGNDPWSVYVMGQSGLEFRVMLSHPTSLKLNIDKRVEADLYPDNDLGDYLETIIPVFQWRSTIPKSIHDVCVPAALISDFKGLGWIKNEKPAAISGPDKNYTWLPADSTSKVTLIWDINGKAMKKDLFNTLNGSPLKLTETDN